MTIALFNNVNTIKPRFVKYITYDKNKIVYSYKRTKNSKSSIMKLAEQVIQKETHKVFSIESLIVNDNIYRVVLCKDNIENIIQPHNKLNQAIPQVSTNRAKTVINNALKWGKCPVITCELESAKMYKSRLETRNFAAEIEEA